MRTSHTLFLLAVIPAIVLSSPLGKTTIDKVRRRPTDASEHDLSVKIVGGTIATAREYPWLGAVVVRGRYGVNAQYCGSSLIAPDTVLTAAHCFMDSNGNQATFASSVSVELNRHDLAVTAGTGSEANAVRVDVDQLYIHPQYSYATNKNDAAILKLKSSVSGITPVGLPASSSSTSSPSSGTSMRVAGWGDTSDGAGTGSRYMRKASVPVVSQSTCSSNYGGGIYSNMICAGYSQGGIDTCQGDSGGPLFKWSSSEGKYVQYGISSFGAGCAQANAPGVYARVSNPTIRSFIAEKMGSSSSSSDSGSSTSNDDDQYCPAACPDSWIQDGQCDSICNTEPCAWDGGDCGSSSSSSSGSSSSSSSCPSSCPSSWIGDGYCDSSCMVSACNYDNGDCDNVNAAKENSKGSKTAVTATAVAGSVVGVCALFAGITLFVRRRNAAASAASPASNQQTSLTSATDAAEPPVPAREGAADIAV